MIVQAALTVLAIFLSLVVLPVSSGAVPSPTIVTVQINGLTVPGTLDCPPPPADTGQVWLYLSGCLGEEVSYSGFKIAGATAGTPAKVVAHEESADSIRIENALIIATSACNNSTNGCGDILFSATFEAPPSGTDGGGNPLTVTFERPATGSLMRGALPATSDWIRVTGWVSGNEIGQPQIKKVTCVNPVATCSQFNNMSQTEDWVGDLTGPRELKGQFWFYLKQTNDKLTITGVRARNPGGAGGSGGGNGPANDPTITTGAADECVTCPDRWWWWAIIIGLLVLILLVLLRCCRARKLPA